MKNLCFVLVLLLVCSLGANLAQHLVISSQDDVLRSQRLVIKAHEDALTALGQQIHELARKAAP